MEFDVVVVGAGPAGLSAAIKLGQLAQEQEQEVSICVVEKGSEVGAHILSGAVFETSALDELLPDWRSMGSPLATEVKEDVFYYYTSGKSAFQIPNLFLPAPVHNDGNYIVSMGNVCRWLAEQAENMGIEVYPGFAAAEVLFNADGSVKGVATGDMGISAEGEQKDSYMPGMELHAKYTLFAEGCRGHLGKQLISHFGLDEGKDLNTTGSVSKRFGKSNLNFTRKAKLSTDLAGLSQRAARLAVHSCITQRTTRFTWASLLISTTPTHM